MRRPLRSDEARSIANLAIDLGDPGRMAKARRLHRSNGVGEVDIEPGVAGATVTDASGELFDVEIGIGSPPINGSIPAATDLETNCACDDQGDTCTHALAALLGIAEAIEANGRQLDHWTGSTAPAPSVDSYTSPPAGDQGFFRGGWTAVAELPELTPLRLPGTPALIVDEIDAGPVVVDAVASIATGLKPYRARQ